MELQAQNAIKFFKIIIFIFLSTPLYSQDVDVDNLINKELVSPVIGELSKFNRHHSKDNKCLDKFISIKFVINPKTYFCEALFYSKSLPNELQSSITNLIKTSKINWEVIIKSHKKDISEKEIEIILPIYFSHSKCPLDKITEAKAWEIFIDLLWVNSKSSYNIILLHPVKSHTSSG